MSIIRSSKVATIVLLFYSAVFAVPAACWISGTRINLWLLLPTSLVAAILLSVACIASPKKKQHVAELLTFMLP